MSSSPRHVGLPFVPRPAPNEILGSWLLRLAQLYGLSLMTLLRRLGVQPVGTPHLPHWYGISARTLSLDALSAATHLPIADIAAMAASTCKPRWPQELGACEKCLADAADAGQPITWNRNWMSPFAVVCSTHGGWLMPVATRSLARVRHAEDFGDILRNLKADQSNDGIPPYVSDAMWLEDLCRARQNLLLPWGVTRPNELVRLVDAVAREVMAATNTNDLAADLRPEFIKCFTLESADFGQIHLSLPTRLRHRQWVLGQVGHVLRWAPEARTTHSSWSVASIERLAPACGWPEGALAWVCPKAAELVRLKHDLLRKFNFSPKYFKACAALRASILGEA